jgi:hypothetical protein
VEKIFFFSKSKTTMSFTNGEVCQIDTGACIEVLDDKFGSFLLFIWGETNAAPSATFGVSKNETGIDWKRLSCVKDSNGIFIVPHVNGQHLFLTLNSSTDMYPFFHVKILG